jgi:hypothetical protein
MFSSLGQAQKWKTVRQIVLSAMISHLTTKCDGNVHDNGVVKITANSVSGINYPRNTADFRILSCFCSEDKTRQRICFDFKTFSIEPTHCTIRPDYLKSWAVEGSDDGASWKEIDRRENNDDLNGKMGVKIFAPSQFGSFGRIWLRQNGPNHEGHNFPVLGAFEVFGAIAGLP